jgi:hypothetical protein
MTEVMGDYITKVHRDVQDTVGKGKLFPSLTYVDPWDVKPEQVHIEDLAHALAIINRYTGGCPFPAPVGMHSIRMARRVMPSLRQYGHMTNAERLRAWQLALAHLVHDGSEALGLNDLASPVKKKPGMEEYCDAHKRAMRAIFIRFDLPFELFAETKVEDDRDFEREVKSFYEPESLTSAELIREIAWRDVEREFLATYRLIQSNIDALKETA